MERPKVNTTAQTPFDVAVGEMVDLNRFGLAIPEDSEQFSLGPCHFERYVHRDPTGFKTVYWKRTA